MIPFEEMRWVLLAGLASCGFAPHAAVPGGGSDGGNGQSDAPVTPEIDARAADATDAMANNARRKPISFNSAVNGTQTDFPVWIDLTDADIAARALSDGSDIYFTASDGTTRLDHQLVGWANNRLTAWVRVPSLKSSTVIYVNYGDAGAAPAQNPPEVFKSSFAAVWHLDDALPATTIADATGTHPGTATLTTTTQSPAKLGGGLTFAASTDTITFTNPLTGSAAHTISVWVNQPAVTHVSAIVVVGTGSQNHARWMYSHYIGASMAVGFYANDWTANSNLDNANWVLLHWVLEANGKNHLYRDGQEITGSPLTLNNIATQGTTGVIGHAPEPTYGTNTGLEGSIDELRIATVMRSGAWIATEYANQSAPSSFYTVGAEQPVP